MKFVKTAVAVAIAGIAAAPMIASAETTLSGVIQVKYQGTDVDEDDPDMAAGDVRVGIGSEHELTSGLVGYGNLQMNLDDLTGENGGIKGLTVPSNPTDTGEDQEQGIDGTVSADNVYVGVKGGFGDLRFGEIPLAVEYGQLANDIHDVGATVSDGASYTGTFGPASVIANFSLEEDSDVAGVGAKFGFAGATIGVGFESRTPSGGDDALTNLAVGASYGIGAFSIAGQFWTQEQAGDADDVENIAVKVGYGVGAVSGAVTFSSLVDDNDVIRLDVAYDMGGGVELSTRIDNTTFDAADSEDLLAYRVMLTKTF